MPGRGTVVEESGGPGSAVSPAAVRSTGSRWRDPRLALGIGVVALCAVLGGWLLATSDDTVGVWTARVPLAEGQQLGAGDLVRQEVRFGGQSDADRYLSADRLPPGGASLARAVGAGELVPRAALGAAASGSLTEVPLSVGSEALPATVHVGSLVDVWVTPDPAGPGASGTAARPTSRSVLVFNDVAVVAVPPAADTLGPTATRQVIVGVPDALGSRLPVLLASLRSGDLLLTTRR
jgi:hypothetical protein